MKPTLSVIIIALTLLTVLGHSGPSTFDNQPAILTVTSLDSDQIVTFDAAFVSGVVGNSNTLDFSRRTTPFRLEIPSPYFFGIFKKVSENAGFEVIIQSRITTVRATSSAVLITKNQDKLKSEGF